MVRTAGETLQIRGQGARVAPRRTVPIGLSVGARIVEGI